MSHHGESAQLSENYFDDNSDCNNSGIRLDEHQLGVGGFVARPTTHAGL